MNEVTADEMEANARLIASAPDMAKEIAKLKADKAELLNGLRAMVGDCASGYDLCTCNKCKGQIVDTARALITKHG